MDIQNVTEPKYTDPPYPPGVPVCPECGYMMSHEMGWRQELQGGRMVVCIMVHCANPQGFHEQLIPQYPWAELISAPKDGTHILAADFSERIGFGGNPPQSLQCVVHWWQWCDGSHPEESGWYPSTGAGDSPALIGLTHWKPLDQLPVTCKCGVTFMPSATHSLDALRKAFCLCERESVNQ